MPGQILRLEGDFLNCLFNITTFLFPPYPRPPIKFSMTSDYDLKIPESNKLAEIVPKYENGLNHIYGIYRGKIPYDRN